MLLIENLSDVATITVSLVPATAVATTEGTGILRAITSAWASSLAFISEGMAAVLTVLVFSWWIIAAGVPAGWGLRRWLRLRRGMALPRMADGTPTQ